MRERNEHGRAPDAIRKLRADDREPHLRFRFQRVRRHDPPLFSSPSQARAAVPLGARAQQSDPSGHRAVAAVLRAASGSLQRDRSPNRAVTDPALALLLIVAPGASLLALRFFKSLDGQLAV